MGPEAFDMAFKEYARRWAFRHPEPADFFRTMEDASGVELAWFWRTWFYKTEKVDQAGNTLSEISKELRDHDRRIVRLETFVEIGKMQHKQLP